MEILKGFPRPVGAVVNLHLVFHRFHQRRHFLWLRWPAQTLLVSDIVTRNAASAGYTPAPRTHRFDCVRLLDPDIRSVYLLFFERSHKSFRACVVVWIAAPTHADQNLALLQYLV